MVLDVNSVYDMDSTFHPDKKPIQKMVKESLRAGCAVNLIKLALHFIRNHFIWIILLVLSQTVRIRYLFFLLNFIELLSRVVQPVRRSHNMARHLKSAAFLRC